MKQLVRLHRIAAQPGQPKRVDYKYERNGTANLFMLCEPMAGWRHVQVTPLTEPRLDYAHLLKDLQDPALSRSIVITVVQDNLLTRTAPLRCTYKAFAPEEARRILQ